MDLTFHRKLFMKQRRQTFFLIHFGEISEKRGSLSIKMPVNYTKMFRLRICDENANGLTAERTKVYWIGCKRHNTTHTHSLFIKLAFNFGIYNY